MHANNKMRQIKKTSGDKFKKKKKYSLLALSLYWDVTHKKQVFLYPNSGFEANE